MLHLLEPTETNASGERISITRRAMKTSRSAHLRSSSTPLPSAKIFREFTDALELENDFSEQAQTNQKSALPTMIVLRCVASRFFPPDNHEMGIYRDDRTDLQIVYAHSAAAITSWA